jgi:hypothetical protein
MHIIYASDDSSKISKKLPIGCLRRYLRPGDGIHRIPINMAYLELSIVPVKILPEDLEIVFRCVGRIRTENFLAPDQEDKKQYEKKSMPHGCYIIITKPASNWLLVSRARKRFLYSANQEYSNLYWNSSPIDPPTNIV